MLERLLSRWYRGIIKYVYLASDLPKLPRALLQASAEAAEPARVKQNRYTNDLLGGILGLMSHDLLTSRALISSASCSRLPRP